MARAAAAGSLNRKLTSSRGRANSLYVLSYYLGGAVGITLSLDALLLLMDGAYMAARMYGPAPDNPAGGVSQAARQLIDAQCKS